MKREPVSTMTDRKTTAVKLKGKTALVLMSRKHTLVNKKLISEVISQNLDLCGKRIMFCSWFWLKNYSCTWSLIPYRNNQRFCDGYQSSRGN